MRQATSQLLRYSEAAERLSVSVRAVRRMVDRRELEITQAPGLTGSTGIRITLRSVQRLIDRQLRRASGMPGDLPPLNA